MTPIYLTWKCEQFNTEIVQATQQIPIQTDKFPVGISGRPCCVSISETFRDDKPSVLALKLKPYLKIV